MPRSRRTVKQPPNPEALVDTLAPLDPGWGGKTCRGRCQVERWLRTWGDRRPRQCMRTSPMGRHRAPLRWCFKCLNAPSRCFLFLAARLAFRKRGETTQERARAREREKGTKKPVKECQRPWGKRERKRERERGERGRKTERRGAGGPRGWCDNFPWGFSAVAFYRMRPWTFTFDHQALHETHWAIVVSVKIPFIASLC